MNKEELKLSMEKRAYKMALIEEAVTTDSPEEARECLQKLAYIKQEEEGMEKQALMRAGKMLGGAALRGFSTGSQGARTAGKGMLGRFLEGMKGVGRGVREEGDEILLTAMENPMYRRPVLTGSVLGGGSMLGGQHLFNEAKNKKALEDYENLGLGGKIQLRLQRFLNPVEKERSILEKLIPGGD